MYGDANGGSSAVLIFLSTLIISFFIPRVHFQPFNLNALNIPAQKRVILEEYNMDNGKISGIFITPKLAHVDNIKVSPKQPQTQTKLYPPLPKSTLFSIFFDSSSTTSSKVGTRILSNRSSQMRICNMNPSHHISTARFSTIESPE